MKKNKTLFLKQMVIVFIFCNTILYSQNITQFDLLTTKDGLAFRNVVSVSQDSLGFMWFGTEQGLNRFDGYNFLNYNSNDENPYFIENDKITNNIYFVRKTNSLWYVANEKLYELKLTTGKINKFTAPEGIKGDVLYLHKDNKDQIWVVSDNFWTSTTNKPYQYLQKYSNGNGFYVVDSIPRASREFTNVTSNKNGTIFWATITKGISEYSNKGSFVQSYKLDSFKWFDEEMHYTLSFFSNNNTWYFFPKSTGGVTIYNPTLNKSIRIIDVPENIYHAIQDSENRIWFAGNTTLYCLEPSGMVKNYTAEIKNLLPFSKINNLFIDSNKLLWIATDNGLIKLQVKKKTFEHLFKTSHNGWGNTMRTILQSKGGNIFAICERMNNLMVIDSLNNQIKFTYKNFSSKDITPIYGSRFMVFNKDSTHLYTVNKSLMKIRLSDGTVTEYSKFAPNFNITSSNPIMRLKNGYLLFGYSLTKLIIFNPEDGSYNKVFKQLSKENDILHLRYFIESEVANQVWIGTQDSGLLKIDLNGTILEHYHVNSTPNLSKNNILVLHEDSDLNLWIGTYGGGLNFLNTSENNITYFKKSDGLPDNNIVGILPYNSNYLWISTYNGLSVYNRNTNDFTNFYEKDGLTHNEFNYTSFFKDKQGRFYFGGMNGINRFYPEDVLQKMELPPLQLTSVTTYNNNDKTEQNTDLSYQNKTELNITPNNQYFQVNWTLPNYFQNKNNIYYTKLEGFENKWFSQKNQPFIRYNKLPAGDYVLKVKGTDANGNKSSRELILPIKVKQIYYKTWWFFTALGIGLFLIIFGLFKYRLQQIRALERLRLKISSDLHDDVGSLLSGLAMQTEILELNAREEDKPKLQKIADVSRQAISQMRDLVWSIDTRRETVADLIERMHELAEDVLLQKDISYTIHHKTINMNRNLTINVKQNLFFIYKEALTNITKHANASIVTVEFKNKFDYCDVIIKDNGVGNKGVPSTGLGLANMIMRAEKMNAHISFKSKNGFRIKIKLPFII